MDTVCISQDVQWFETETECKQMLSAYKEVPIDGNWSTVEYICKPVGSISS
jgi:hypothetical protein|tara:strand:+ start:2008 stop:2160 length:153 start_codon:yes stop_codon:yes gene_type:complete